MIMTKNRKKDKNALVNHKNLERNVANEISNELYKDKNKPKK